MARGANGVIGNDGKLPWHLGSDLKLFRRLTMGKPLIMGRKTWDSLPLKPLPGRLNIVLSRDGTFAPAKAVVCEDFTEAVQIGRDQAREDGVDEICVIGGAAVFAAALPRAQRIYLTDVDTSPEGDVVFPPFDESAWQEVRREAFAAGETDDHAFVFRILERRR